MLGTRERRAMTVLVDHVSECRIAHRHRVKHVKEGKAVIMCEFPGCASMVKLLWHNLSCRYWGTGGGDPMDQLIELYTNKDPKKLNKRNMNKMAQKGAEGLAEMAQDEREHYGLPMQGSWCLQCREAANLQRSHSKHCRGFRKLCYIPGCGGPELPETNDLVAPKYEGHKQGVAAMKAKYDNSKLRCFECLGI